MIPVDFSRDTFEDLKQRLEGLRQDAHLAWIAHGPGTTRDIAEKSGMDILSFRPRSTELYQLGLLELIGHDGKNGRYRARDVESWERFIAAKRLPPIGQLALSKL